MMRFTSAEVSLRSVRRALEDVLHTRISLVDAPKISVVRLPVVLIRVVLQIADHLEDHISEPRVPNASESCDECSQGSADDGIASSTQLSRELTQSSLDPVPEEK